jgi:hypothetical protein
MLMSKDNHKIANINVACKYAIYSQGTESALLDKIKNVYFESVKYSTNANGVVAQKCRQWYVGPPTKVRFPQKYE